METLVDISQYDSRFSLRNKVGRLAWNLVYWLLFRPFAPGPLRPWRIFLLRSFGARVDRTANVYASCRIWAPWNLRMGKFACLGPGVDCYNQGSISIGDHTIVSQKAYLCASTHDHTQRNFPLVLRPIAIEDQAWVAAEAFIGPGVTVGQGAVVGARSAVFRNVAPWSVVGGNPATFIKNRDVQ